jgi:hypothetical protein
MGKTRAIRKTPAILPILPPPPVIDPVVPTPTILPQPTPAPRANERVLTYNADGALHPVIYGEVKNLGCAVSYWKAIASGRVLVRYIIGYGPIESISNIRIDNLTIAQLGLGAAIAHGSTTPVTKGHQIFLGTANQAVSTLFVQYRGGAWIQSRAPGVAFVDILFPDYTESSLNTFPDITNFKCDVKGLKIRDYAQDPTLVTRYFSEDPALIIADLLTSKRYGGRIPDANINWSWVATDVSPYIMQDIGGGVKRYPIGVVLLHQQNLDTHIENLRAHAQLYIPYNNGMYNILVDKPRADSGIIFTDENILKGSRLRTLGSSEVFERVNVSYIDSAQEWIQKSTPIELPGLSVGSIAIDEKSYSLLGTRTFSQAKRIGTYLINRSILDKVIYFKTNEVGKQPLPGDRIKITDVELNLVNQDIIITSCEPNEGVWDFVAEIYDEDVYSDVVQTEFSVVEPDYPSPHDIPDPPTGLVLTQEIDEDLLTNIKIEFIPADISYNSQFTRINIRKNSGDWFKLIDTTESVQYINNVLVGEFWEVELKTMSAAPYLLASAILVSSITVASAQNVSDIINPHIDFAIDSAGDLPAVLTSGTVYWDAPQIRSNTLYGSPFWSNGSSLGSFDATKVNDGLFTATAFTTPSGSASWLKHSTGSGLGKRFRSFKIYFTGTLQNTPSPQWSNDGSTGWTNYSAGNTVTSTKNIGGGVTCLTIEVNDIGADKEFFRIHFSNTISTTNIVTEVHFSTYDGEFTDFQKYRIYLNSGVNRELIFPNISKDSRPTATTPLNVTEYVSFSSSWDSSHSAALELEITVVNSSSVESDGIIIGIANIAMPSSSGAIAPFIPQIFTTLSLSNGLNSNIELFNGPGAQNIIDPTAAFSIGGFVAPLGGSPLVLFNYSGTQVLTIRNQDASSTDINRIITLTGGDIVIVGPCIFSVWYDHTSDRWILQGFKDGTISALGNGQFTVLRSQNTTTQASMINPDASGITASAGFMATGDIASAAFLSHGSGRTAVRAGEVIGGWSELRALAGDGLLIGVQHNAPLKLYTNSLTVLEIDTSQKLKIGGGDGISKHLSSSITFNLPNLAPGGFTTTTMTLTGVASTDVFSVSHSANTLGTYILTAAYASSNTVIVTIFSPAGDDLGSGTLRVDAWRH